MNSMKPKNIAHVFLTLMSLLLVCSSSAFAGDQVQNQKGIIYLIEHEHHQADIIGTIKNYCNTLWFYGEVLISDALHKINHNNNIHAEGDNVTTQADLDFWHNLQAQYPFSEKPVFISMNSVCGPVYDYVPEGVSEVTVMDNSGNAQDSYTVTKYQKGFTIQKGVTSNPGHSYTITPAIPVLNKNICERQLNFLIFRNNFITLSTCIKYGS
jgi:hypothetical protein